MLQFVGEWHGEALRGEALLEQLIITVADSSTVLSQRLARTALGPAPAWGAVA